MYDAIVGELKKLSPDTKFVGLSLSRVRNPEYFEYFLNPKNHQPGIPLDCISYHHYSQPSWTWNDQPLDVFQYTYFEKAEAFFDRVRYIENIRKRLSPNTITMVNEIGTMTHTPKHASWMNQVEIWLSILVRKVIKRGSFSSVKELKRKVLAFIDYYNRTMAKPFKWTYQGKALAA
jgi:hypothetical protein